VKDAARPPLLEARAMSKRFAGVCALDDVSFRLEPGSFHALLGENGAGKSTLVKCIMGFYRADSGSLHLGDREIDVASPKDAQRQGLGMVYQHFTLVENMTVAENLVLARADVPRVIDWRKEQQTIDEFMSGMPFRVDPRRTVRKLAAGEKQKLEILKQLYLGSRIVILDEPTSVLTPQEADEVLGMLRTMAHEGRVSVAMITHKFREVTAFADEVTVLRRGRVAGTGRTSDLTPERMAELMVGEEPARASLERSERVFEAPVLELSALTADDDIGLPVLNGVSIKVHPGEIVGIAGVSGNGQDELVEVLAGQRPASGGDVLVSGEPYRPTRRQMQSRRLLCIWRRCAMPACPRCRSPRTSPSAVSTPRPSRSCAGRCVAAR
jgi:simple sugar transport system ATP-binding protein